MKEQMEALRQRFESELQAAQNSEAVEKLRVAYLGKKGSVTELLKGLKSVAGDQKKEMGQLITELQRQVEAGPAGGEDPRRRGAGPDRLCRAVRRHLARGPERGLLPPHHVGAAAAGGDFLLHGLYH